MPPPARNKPIGLIEVIVVLSSFASIVPGAFFLRGVQPPPGETWQYWMLGICGTGLVGGSIVLILRKLRKDKARDWFSDWSVAPYEHAGVHLIPVIAPSIVRPGGKWRLCVFYQNRFDAMSQLKVLLNPIFQWDLDVGPAEVGMVWKDFALPPGLKSGLFTLTLRASGRRGKGAELRFRLGSSISRLESIRIGAEVTPRSDLELPAAEEQGRIILSTPGGNADDETELFKAIKIAGVEVR